MKLRVVRLCFCLFYFVVSDELLSVSLDRCAQSIPHELIFVTLSLITIRSFSGEGIPDRRQPTNCQWHENFLAQKSKSTTTWVHLGQKLPSHWQLSVFTKKYNSISFRILFDKTIIVIYTFIELARRINFS